MHEELEQFDHPHEEVHFEIHEDTEKAFHDVSMEYEHGANDPYTENPPFSSGFQLVDDTASGNTKESDQVISTEQHEEDLANRKIEEAAYFESEFIESQGGEKEIESRAEDGEGGVEAIVDEDSVHGVEEVQYEGVEADSEYQQNDEEVAEGGEYGEEGEDVVGEEQELAVENDDIEARNVEDGGEFAQADEEEYDEGGNYVDEVGESRYENFEDDRSTRAGDGNDEGVHEGDAELENANAQYETNVEAIENSQEGETNDETRNDESQLEMERALNDLSAEVEEGLEDADHHVLDEEVRDEAVEEGISCWLNEMYLIFSFLTEGEVISENFSRKRSRDEDPLHSQLVSDLPHKRLRNSP